MFVLLGRRIVDGDAVAIIKGKALQVLSETLLPSRAVDGICWWASQQTVDETVNGDSRPVRVCVAKRWTRDSAEAVCGSVMAPTAVPNVPQPPRTTCRCPEPFQQLGRSGPPIQNIQLG